MLLCCYVSRMSNVANRISFSLQERFHHILKGVCHERFDVRRDALKALYKLQKQSRVSSYPYTLLCIIQRCCHRVNWKCLW